MSSDRLQRTSYPMKSTTDRGGHPFHGEEKGVGEPAESVKTRKSIAGLAYGQNIFDHDPSNAFIDTEGLVVGQEPPVYPGVDTIDGPLFHFFDQKDFEPNLS